MKIIQYDNLYDFLNDCEELLLNKESFYSLILGSAYGIRDQIIEPTEPLYFTIKDKNNVTVAAALRSNVERPFAITEMIPVNIDLLIENLLDRNIILEAVVGEEATANYFKNRWIHIKKLNFKVSIHLGVYECHQVKLPKLNSENLIQATENHVDILKTYITGFSQDCFPDKPIIDENIEKLMYKHLKNKSLYLLQLTDTQIVSMVANTRSTLNGGTISLVYTPPNLRAKGYASVSVALLTDKIIKNGKKFATLFTDLTNPTSNSIYQKIGFVKIGQNIQYDFIE